MSEHFKFSRIMNFTPLVIIIVVRLGNDRAHFPFTTLKNRSEHVATTQKTTHTNQRNETQQNTLHG